MKKRVIVLGIDGASLDLILSRIKEGGLRNFKKIIEGGSCGPLRSTFIANSASAWTSFMTGKNPGKHGIYDFFESKNYSPECVYFSNIEDKPFWDILSDRGRKSYVVNVPLTYPPKIKDGVMVSGFQTPSDKQDFVYPGSFKSELERVCSEYNILPSADPGRDIRGHIAEIDSILRI